MLIRRRTSHLLALGLVAWLWLLALAESPHLVHHALDGDESRPCALLAAAERLPGALAAPPVPVGPGIVGPADDLPAAPAPLTAPARTAAPRGPPGTLPLAG